MPSLQGVRGWLLFLCVSLTIWTPLKTLADIGQAGRTLATASLADWFVIAFSGYGVYAGVSLWRISKGAVRKAQVFFYIAFLLAVLSAVGAWMGRDYKTSLESLVAIGQAALWLAYLGDSKRVKATYFVSDEPAPVPVPLRAE